MDHECKSQSDTKTNKDEKCEKLLSEFSEEMNDLIENLTHPNTDEILGTGHENL